MADHAQKPALGADGLFHRQHGLLALRGCPGIAPCGVRRVQQPQGEQAPAQTKTGPGPTQASVQAVQQLFLGNQLGLAHVVAELAQKRLVARVLHRAEHLCGRGLREGRLLQQRRHAQVQLGHALRSFLKTGHALEHGSDF